MTTAGQHRRHQANPAVSGDKFAAIKAGYCPDQHHPFDTPDSSRLPSQ